MSRQAESKRIKKQLARLEEEAPNHPALVEYKAALIQGRTAFNEWKKLATWSQTSLC